MLQIQHICKEYRTGNLVQKALDDVSLNLRDNEFVAILGPSGSGKTTLLNIIGGLDRYDSGDLIINGISTKKYKDRDWDSYRNHTIGFVFQSYNLIPHQTVLANVELALTISGIGKAQRKKKAIEALKKVGLGEQLHKKPNQMSGGQMQRVAIARALVNDPDILLADEPTGALDSDTSVQVMDLLQEVAKDRLVVMVTHNPELAKEYATRIVNLRDGKIRSDTDPYEVDEAILTPPEHKNMGKSSMSFMTALSLSFNNLKTKKARTLLTSFAGSIGIIGIALILSLSTGVNKYIQNIEEETLSEYPLQIQSTGFDITSMMVGAGGGAEENVKKNKDDGKIKVIQMVTNMFATMNSNDLKSLKNYLDNEEASGIRKYTNAIEYSYNVSPQIFKENGDKIRPYIIHRTSLGCYERTLAWLIEHYAGKFPTWLCPEQVRVLPISEKYADYAKKVADELKRNDVDVTVDNRAEKIGYKIREARMDKLPYMLVVGADEEADGTVSVRSRFEGNEGVKPLSDFIDQICKEIRTKEIRVELPEEEKHR